jgi:hypothetical protein
MHDVCESGEVERSWAEAVEDLGVPAKLWDQVIAREFSLPPGKKLPDAFMLLMRDWVQDGGERYDYVRPYGMCDTHYVGFLLAQASCDTDGNDGEVLWDDGDAIEQQRQKAIDDFNQDNIFGPMN